MTTITSILLSSPLTGLANLTIDGSDSVTDDIGRITTTSAMTATVTGGHSVHANSGDCLTTGLSTLVAPVSHHSPSSATRALLEFVRYTKFRLIIIIIFIYEKMANVRDIACSMFEVSKLCYPLPLSAPCKNE